MGISGATLGGIDFTLGEEEPSRRRDWAQGSHPTIMAPYRPPPPPTTAELQGKKNHRTEINASESGRARDKKAGKCLVAKQ